MIALPILVVLGHLFLLPGPNLRHLVQTVLVTYLLNSGWLILGVGLGTVTLGVSTAWCITLCDFPGRRFYEWALLLPLAVPAYVLAYTYTDLLDVAGPVQTTLRTILRWEVRSYWFPNIRSVGGAIAMLTLALYPYIYMLSKVAFIEQAQNTLEASRSLGCKPWRSFFTVALPLARPSIIAGLSLVLMETLSDFGTVQYFSVDTFTTGIYRTWAGMGDRGTATQLSALLLLGIFGLILLESWSRGKARYYQTGAQGCASLGYKLHGARAFGASLLCFFPLCFGFLLPAGRLALMATRYFALTFGPNFIDYAIHSLVLALTSGAIAVILATVIAYSVRLQPSLLMRSAARISAIGYAIPGSVIAVGISFPLGWSASFVNGGLSLVGIESRWVLSGTVGALIFAYLVRFLAVSYSTIEAGLFRIKPHLDEAARSLGYGPGKTLLNVHAPLMWSSLLTALMLAFVDVMKELPATLMIRPFNFDTLAIRVYRLASDERLAEASGAALAIVGVGLIPVLVLSFKLTQTRRRSTSSPLDPQF